MSNAIIAIGISGAPGLPVLHGAATDAQRMIDWAARSKEYPLRKLLTDKDGPVTFAKVEKAVTAFMAKDGLQRLIIYFAGHGYSPIPGHEMLMLSKWQEDVNEAINLGGTIAIAQQYARPQIALIIDACRTSWNSNSTTYGGVILKRPKRRPASSQVDQFFATAFGFSAYEAKIPNNPKTFGVFTDELLKALDGDAALAQVDARGRTVVTSRSLERHLDDAVPRASKKLGVKQIPETIPQWKEGKDIYCAFDLTPPPARPAAKRAKARGGGGGGGGIVIGPTGSIGRILPADPWGPTLKSYPFRAITGSPKGGGERGARGNDKDLEAALRIMARVNRSSAAAGDLARAIRSRMITLEVTKIRQLKGRESFETGVGATIVGARVASAHFKGREISPTNVFLENQAHQVRLPEKSHGTLLVQLRATVDGKWNAHWIAVPIFPDRIATVRIDEKGFSSLNYRVSISRGGSGEFLPAEKALADATACLLHGDLPRGPSYKAMIDALRHTKDENPALAIVAAHVCQRTGDFGVIRDMLNYDIGGGAFTPYDLQMLLGGRARRGRIVVGDFPQMARAWGFLSIASTKPLPHLTEISRHVVPSLWTMVKPAAGPMMIDVLRWATAKA